MKCNWLRHLGIKKHGDVVENGGCGGDMGGQGEGEVELTIMLYYYLFIIYVCSTWV